MVNMSLSRSVGKRIQVLRKIRKLTQEEMEDKTGINSKYLSAIEMGKCNITLKTIEKIAKSLDIEPYELFLYKEEKESEQELRKAIEKLIKEVNKEKLSMIFKLLRIIVI